jgi:hypothetical protein
MRTCVRNWSECSLSIHALCKVRGIDYLHALQPTLHDTGSKPVTPKERRMGRASVTWREAVALGYPLMKEAGALLAGRGLAFFDATRVFDQVETTLYYDACHFVPEGHVILAEAIGAAFLDARVSSNRADPSSPGR